MSDETESGKEFDPEEHADDQPSAATVHGGGKNFAPDVGSPDDDPEAETGEGSGKEFAPNVQDPESDPDAKGTKGSGKQFEPGRDSL